MNDTKRYFVVYVNRVNEIEVELFKVTNVKDCIIQFAKSVGDDSRLFRKALMRCESDSEYIEMYKQFGSCVIDAIYEVNNVEYWKNEKGKGKGEDTNGQRNCITPVLLGEC